MIYFKKSVSLIISLLIAFLFIFTVSTSEVISSEKEIEETADMKLGMDIIIEGEMNEYSKSHIFVDNTRYSFCSRVKVYTPGSKLTTLDSLNIALKVKLFVNKKCVRKIKVLRFAE